MSNFIKDLIRGEPHPLNEIRESLDVDAQDQTAFFPLLKTHHGFIVESIDVLTDAEATDFAKQNHLFRFFRLLEMHARAEEETLYLHLRQNHQRDARIEGHRGQDEHDVAFQLEDELIEMGYQTVWNEEIAAKSRVVASLVQNHIKEEESGTLRIAARLLESDELEAMRGEYLEKCKTYLDESQLTSLTHPLLRSRPDSRRDFPLPLSEI